MNFSYGKEKLTLKKVFEIAAGKRKGVLIPAVIEGVQKSNAIVQQVIRSGKTVYGINTGFGPLCDTLISEDETQTLQKNLLLTHAVGVGKPIEPLLSKIMMICKVHALCQGHSGIRLALIERILYHIDHDLLPAVPEQGSVGASGDLAPLSHLFLPLIGEGEIWENNQLIPAKKILDQHKLQPLVLEAK
ncbi:aromatic amino acid ammonia-lyase, partial [Flavobacteriaceae bacterium]|nr:aromatic amino acid ammonia-lyase [Flavobacteriaceae bacterium]